MFSGEYEELASEKVLDPLMAYLQQAAHVNAMIDGFVDVDARVVSNLTHTPLMSRKQHYLSAISSYCSSEIPATLDALDAVLGEAC